MTKAGWTRERPTEAGWYWWRNLQKKYAVDQGPFIYMVRWYGNKLAIGNCDIEDSHYTRGEWLGPLTPDSYQQGRVAGLREGAEMVPGIMQHPHGSSKDWCEAQRAICAAIKRRAQQAQEGGVGDANG